MGAWAEDAFGNDAACDWAGDFSDDPSMDIVTEAIARVVDEEEYIDASDACECLAACEVVARLNGQWGERSAYSEAIDEWVESANIVPSDDLLKNAKLAIQKILSDKSELAELWDEDGENEKWHAEVDDLLKRVSAK